jgi:soluble cytochrome b562
MIIVRFTILSLALLTSAFIGLAQDTTHQASIEEIKAEVPALSEFHTVIFKVWHEAWPSKNVQLLVELLPDIQKGTEAVVKAELPGILRDKKTAWAENTKRLQAIVEEYTAAAASVDSVKLLDAAEQLHGQYEKLVHTIRPALPELEDFHTSLYPLYHYYLPQNDQEKIKTSVAELKVKMVALNKATLPERLKTKEAKFSSARTKLAKSIDALDKVVAKGNPKEIKTAIQKMHTDYQALEKVFD